MGKNNTIRYIYILGYKDIDGIYTLCKVDINVNQIIRYGCEESNRHLERQYMIHRQPVTYKGKISLYAKIYPSKTYIN